MGNRIHKGVRHAPHHRHLRNPAQDSGVESRRRGRSQPFVGTILGKDPKVTAVIVTENDPADWFCGGRSLADQKLASFWLDIHITDGTNTKDEKAAFVAEAFKAMGKLLGPLHNESYVHVHDVRGDAYGFGGLTQERRYIARVLAAPAASAA